MHYRISQWHSESAVQCWDWALFYPRFKGNLCCVFITRDTLFLRTLWLLPLTKRSGSTRRERAQAERLFCPCCARPFWKTKPLVAAAFVHAQHPLLFLLSRGAGRWQRFVVLDCSAREGDRGRWGPHQDKSATSTRS